MKLAIFGATGYLGTFFCKFALQHPALSKLYLFSRRIHPELLPDPKLEQQIFKENFTRNSALCAVDELLKVGELDALVYIAALSSPSVCEKEPELAWFLNYELYVEIAGKLNASEVPSFYVSTDLVFDGSKAPPAGFTEQTAPRPVSVYAKSKFAAEQFMLELQRGAILRSSLIYGPILPDVAGNLAWMLESMDRGEPLRLFRDEWRTPVFVEDVAQVLLQIVLEGRTGIYHAAGPERLSRVEFGQAIARIRGVYEAQIVECSRKDQEISPPRPEDVSLNTAWTSSRLNFQFSALEDGLRRSLR